VSLTTFDTAQGAFAMFDRAIHFYDIATGKKKVTGSLGTKGKASATHTEPFVSKITASSGSPAYQTYAHNLYSFYSSKDNRPPPSVSPIPTSS
jgi:hypothetical protein